MNRKSTLWGLLALALLSIAPASRGAEPAPTKIVRFPAGARAAALAALHDDQIIETPAGHRLSAKRYRAILRMFAAARARTGNPLLAGFQLAPRPNAAAVPVRAGETAAQLLARPATGAVLVAPGRSVSVAQLRAMAPWVERRYGVQLFGSPAAPQALAGAATGVKTIAQLKELAKSAPDSTVLESPKGTQITLGQLRAAARAAGAKPAPQVVR
jgi:hypothetical protein